MTDTKTLPLQIGDAVIDVPEGAWDEIVRLRMLCDQSGLDWRRNGPPMPLDAAGNPILTPTMLERHMAQALNSVKAWADMQPPAPFPWGVRESVEAVLMAYEIRRRQN